MNLYVGNLSFRVNDADFKEAFGALGAVSSASVIKDKRIPAFGAADDYKNPAR